MRGLAAWLAVLVLTLLSPGHSQRTWRSGSGSGLRSGSYAVSRGESPRNRMPRVSPCKSCHRGPISLGKVLPRGAASVPSHSLLPLAGWGEWDLTTPCPMGLWPVGAALCGEQWPSLWQGALDWGSSPFPRLQCVVGAAPRLLLGPKQWSCPGGTGHGSWCVAESRGRGFAPVRGSHSGGAGGGCLAVEEGGGDFPP